MLFFNLPARQLAVAIIVITTLFIGASVLPTALRWPHKAAISDLANCGSQVLTAMIVKLMMRSDSPSALRY